MVFMTAGMLDHRNIGSNITMPHGGGSISGALALVIQDGTTTEILFAHDDESITVDRSTPVDVSLPTAAAYTLHMKNAVEDLLAALAPARGAGKNLRAVG